MGILSFIFIGVYLLKISALAQSTSNHGGYESGFLCRPKGVHRRGLLASTSGDYCDNNNLCGPNGMCVITNSPVCTCLNGFEPKAPEKYNSGDNSGGCVRAQPSNCQNKDDGFEIYAGVKLPDTTDSRANQSMSVEDCRENCLNNCSCVAYAISKVNGCTIWFGDLINMRTLSGGGEDLYIRTPASELKKNHSPKTKIAVIVASVVAVVIGMLLVAYCVHRRRTKFKEKMGENGITNQNNDGQNEDIELPIFSLSTIVTATDNFSFNMKLGEGGFGTVYKGSLVDGLEIAVKRLSRSSGQGPTEFKNEVLLIAKLQHRNLVRLLGCCIEGEERLLIYEYMPNNSLDFYLFDENRARLLAWPQRFHIICGIARGLLYLHQDSRLRIIHRDLKASNVLLDKEMNPKISDFGMARTFGGDQTEGVTRRVVGTYGYMAPEYAIDGQFSVKSDVFSFGILLLETLSGKRSRGFHDPVDNLNLIGHAWRLWKEGRSSELIDESLRDSCSLSEILCCFHVSLLCVQELPEDRPNISTVILMLGGGSALPQPKKPGFFGRSSSAADSSSSPWCGFPMVAVWDGSFDVWEADLRPSSIGVALVWSELDRHDWVLDRGRQTTDGGGDCTIVVVGGWEQKVICTSSSFGASFGGSSSDCFGCDGFVSASTFWGWRECDGGHMASGCLEMRTELIFLGPNPPMLGGSLGVWDLDLGTSWSCCRGSFSLVDTG